MPATTDQRLLDNAVWHSITGAHASLSIVKGDAGHFERDVSVFGALRDQSSNTAWADLRELGEIAILFAGKITEPDGWTREYTAPSFQMVAEHVNGKAVHDYIELGPSDQDDMLTLVNATRPGPFQPRTPELGRYIGHRVDGRLVAMAGERLRVEGYTEISAVCTDPGHRGKGLAANLVLALVEHIRDRGDEAFLHVEHKNPAKHLYDTLGFMVRRDAEGVMLRATT